MMKQLNNGVNISESLYNIMGIIAKDKNITIDKIFNDIKILVDEFANINQNLLKKRDEFQDKINDFFKNNNNSSTSQLVDYLKEISYLPTESSNLEKVATKDVDVEISQMAGSQLVVPADKVNMVLNAANARWGSLYNAVYGSNIIDKDIEDRQEREKLVIEYTHKFLDKIIKLSDDISWLNVNKIKFLNDEKKLLINDSEKILPEKLIGTIEKDGNISALLFSNNKLKIQICLDSEEGIKDILLESALTYIIDLEDASLSAPDNKIESYRILHGLLDGTLECEVRGKIRKIANDIKYKDIKTSEIINLKYTSLPLVRDVGPHLNADINLINIDGKAIPEKILDIYITSLIGMRYHVAPKMHSEEEVTLNVRLLDRINKMQNLPDNANKIGIMNEEIRMNSRIKEAVLAAKDIVFFINTGFLDYTGSFIDFMMHKGPITPYRLLASQLYKTSYEINNVNVGLDLGVAQIGAGMWAKIQDLKSMIASKIEQIEGGTDTGWAPSPNASVIHSYVFHILDYARDIQAKLKANPENVKIEDMFTFPRAVVDELTEDEIIKNINYAIHGLIAYAKPWVRDGIGCSGVKELSGEPLMEDRATARIKAAFVRNWLLHNVVTKEQVENSIKEMAKIVDNQSQEGEKALHNNELENNLWDKVDEVIKAVLNVVFNPYEYKHSYVEPYFYEANRNYNS